MEKSTFVDEFYLSVRAGNILKQMGVTTRTDVLNLTERRLLQERNCGIKTTAELMLLKTATRMSQFSHWVEIEAIIKMLIAQHAFENEPTEGNLYRLSRFQDDVRTARASLAVRI